MWIWYLDRGSAIVAITGLWLAVFTGIFCNARAFGALYKVSKALHTPTSVLASVTMLAHVAVGAVDASLVLRGDVPHPAYSDAYFIAGLAVGAGALLVTVTAVLGFIDAKKFKRPWDPRAVHALAYAGFVFALVHGIAVGTDLVALVSPGLVAATVFLLVALVVRFLGRARPAPPKARPQGDL